MTIWLCIKTYLHDIRHKLVPTKCAKSYWILDPWSRYTILRDYQCTAREEFDGGQRRSNPPPPIVLPDGVKTAESKLDLVSAAPVFVFIYHHLHDVKEIAPRRLVLGVGMIWGIMLASTKNPSRVQAASRGPEKMLT